MAFRIYKDLYYTTFTVNNWVNLFYVTENTQIILNSFQFLVDSKRVAIYAFVIMPNHIHIIWEMLGEYSINQAIHNFQSFTAKQILKSLSNFKKEIFKVQKSDRNFQIWKKSPLSVAIETPMFLRQKINYTHDNPSKANLVEHNSDYNFVQLKHMKMEL